MDTYLNNGPVKVNINELNNLTDSIKGLQTITTTNSAALNFLTANASNILLRKLVNSQPGNIDSFVISTSGRPEDVILYTSNNDQVVLDDVAGTGLQGEPTNQPLDGGSF